LIFYINLPHIKIPTERRFKQPENKAGMIVLRGLIYRLCGGGLYIKELGRGVCV